MPRKFLRRFLPDHKQVRAMRGIHLFGTLLHDPNLWHLNRRSVAGGAAVGLFCAFVPIPFQMVLAAAIAIIARVNLPIAAAGVWVSNPFTMPPLFYFAYRVGKSLLGMEGGNGFHFELSFAWLGSELEAVWAPFLLGCFVLGSISALFAYMLVRGLWRLQVIRYWQQRKHRVN